MNTHRAQRLRRGFDLRRGPARKLAFLTACVVVALGGSLGCGPKNWPPQPYVDHNQTNRPGPTAHVTTSVGPSSAGTPTLRVPAPAAVYPTDQAGTVRAYRDGYRWLCVDGWTAQSALACRSHGGVGEGPQ